MSVGKEAGLPDEYRMDVAGAAKGLALLAEREPDAPVVLTLAQFGSAGIEAEQDVWLRASEAAALLATVGEDQRLQAGAHALVLLRVTRAARWPQQGEEPSSGPEIQRERFEEPVYGDD